MAKRKSIPASTRFEVFKRDSFKCQYCGRSAPEVVLHVDHIEPVRGGGSDDIMNLASSCQDCNLGKGARRLSDDSAVAKQKAQLDELNERREQLEMMLRWRQGLQEEARDSFEVFHDAYRQHVPGWSLTDKGKKRAKALIRSVGLQAALHGLDLAAERVLEFKDGKPVLESVEYMFNLAHILAQPEDVQRLYKIRARIRSRWNHVDDNRCLRLLKRALEAGSTPDRIEAVCEDLMRERNTSFRWWASEMEDAIQRLIMDKGV